MKHINFKSWRTRTIILVISLALLASLVGVGLHVSAAGTGPCDIYASAGTPCVAAHSTVRALYGAYSGRLYQVKRASNGNTTDIGTLSAGGIANAAAQDSFCSGTTCTITIIYDQSGRGNDLTPAPAGGAKNTPDNPANATALPITINGQKAYGVWIDSGMGYRRDSTSGIATGDTAETEYMVTSGTHYNGGCCFDYGNAETNNNDDGAGTMEAVFFGNIKVWTYGTGNGPWVMADLENGLFGCSASPNGSQCSNNPTISNTFVTAMVKGHSGNSFGLKEGNAQSGGLTTVYNGARPSGYSPMKKQGAIILGIGGDNSNSSVGSFYEGVMVTGDPSDATDNSVQANIVAAYGSGGSGPTPTPGPTTPPGSYVQLINQNSNKCLDVQMPNTSDGANVDLWTCNGNTWQKWQLVDLGTGYYKIVSQNSGKCLDVTGNGTADGANVEQWACNGGTNQQWKKTTTTSPWFKLTARNSGKVLDVSGCGTADGTNVQQWTDLNNTCQGWKTQ